MDVPLESLFSFGNGDNALWQCVNETRNKLYFNNYALHCPAEKSRDLERCLSRYPPVK